MSTPTAAELTAQVRALEVEQTAAHAAADEAARQLLYELRNGMGAAYLATARERVNERHRVVDQLPADVVRGAREQVDALAASAPQVVDRVFDGFPWPHTVEDRRPFSPTLSGTLGPALQRLWGELGRILVANGIDEISTHDWTGRGDRLAPGTSVATVPPPELDRAWRRYDDAWETCASVDRELRLAREALSKAQAVDKWGG